MTPGGGGENGTTVGGPFGQGDGGGHGGVLGGGFGGGCGGGGGLGGGVAAVGSGANDGEGGELSVAPPHRMRYCVHPSIASAGMGQANALVMAASSIQER